MAYQLIRTFIRYSHLAQHMKFPHFSVLSIVLGGSMLLANCSTPEEKADVKSSPGPEVPAFTNSAAPTDATGPSGVVTDPNPAHGEPGHICEIPVGASLSTAPAPGAGGPMITADPSISAMPIQPTITAPGAGTVTAPGMNPPHGEPGHDCAVAVGSPLPK